MKVFSLVFLMVLFIACEKQVVMNSVVGAKVQNSIDQAYCSIAERANGTLMSCPDGELHYLVTSENENECEAIQLAFGVLYSCQDGETSLIESSYHSRVLVSEITDPCGTQSLNDEVILLLEDARTYSFRQSNSELYFEERLVGAHSTLDGTNCNYQIDQNKNINW